MQRPLPPPPDAWPSGRAPGPVDLARTALRRLRTSDAPSLHWIMHPAVGRYLPGVPQTPERLAQYAAWAERQSGLAGQLSLAVVVGGRPIGIIQGWSLEPSGKTIEWGFALEHSQWGEGLMQEGGRAFLSFAVTQLGVERIEARTAVNNLRAIATLLRLGARCERVIPRGLADKTTDCFLWSILAADVKRHGCFSATPAPTTPGPRTADLRAPFALQAAREVRASQARRPSALLLRQRGGRHASFPGRRPPTAGGPRWRAGVEGRQMPRSANVLSSFARAVPG